MEKRRGLEKRRGGRENEVEKVMQKSPSFSHPSFPFSSHPPTLPTSHAFHTIPYTVCAYDLFVYACVYVYVGGGSGGVCLWKEESVRHLVWQLQEPTRPPRHQRIDHSYSRANSCSLPRLTTSTSSFTVGWFHVRVRSESSAWVPCSCGSESSWIVLLGAIWDGRGSCVGLWTGSWIRCRFHIRVRVHVHVRGLVRFRIHCHGNGNGIGRGCCEDRRLCCGGGSLIRRIAGAAAGGSGYL